MVYIVGLTFRRDPFLSSGRRTTPASRSSLTLIIDGFVWGRAIPCNTACTVIDIVGQTEKINSSFPSLRKRAILILVGIEVMLCIGDWLSKGDDTRCGRSR